MTQQKSFLFGTPNFNHVDAVLNKSGNSEKHLLDGTSSAKIASFQPSCVTIRCVVCVVDLRKKKST